MWCRYTLRNMTLCYETDIVLAIKRMISVFPHQIALEADELYSGGQSSVGAAALSFNRLHQVRTELVSTLQNTQNHQIMMSDVFKDVSGQTLNPINHIRSQCHKLCVCVCVWGGHVISEIWFKGHMKLIRWFVNQPKFLWNAIVELGKHKTKQWFQWIVQNINFILLFFQFKRKHKYLMVLAILFMVFTCS